MVEQIRETAAGLRESSTATPTLPVKETMVKLEILNELAVILGAVANGKSKGPLSFRWRLNEANPWLIIYWSSRFCSWQPGSGRTPPCQPRHHAPRQLEHCSPSRSKLSTDRTLHLSIYRYQMSSLDRTGTEKSYGRSRRFRLGSYVGGWGRDQDGSYKS